MGLVLLKLDVVDNQKKINELKGLIVEFEGLIMYGPTLSLKLSPRVYDYMIESVHNWKREVASLEADQQRFIRNQILFN